MTFPDEPAARRPLDEESFHRTLRRTPLALTVALIVPALASLGLIIYVLRATEAVKHIERVIAQTLAVEKLAVDMETGLRGFQTTGDERFLEPWREAEPQLHEGLAALEALAADNRGQRGSVGGWRERFGAWREFAEQTLAQQRAEVAAVREADHNLRGKQLMDAVRAQTAVIVGEETRARAERDRRLKQVVLTLFILLGVGVVAGIPALVAWTGRRLGRVADSYRISLTEAEAKRTELGVMLRSIGDAVIATDAEGAIELLNPVAERLTGWSDGEARGRAITEVLAIYHEESGEPAPNPVERVLRERTVVGLANHTVLRPRGGGEIPIEDSAAPIFHPDGSLRGVILVFHDVTEKHAQVRELRNAEWLMRMSLDAGGGGAWVIEVDRGVVAGDAMLARSFNVPVEECRQGAPIATFVAAIHEEDRARVNEAVDRSLSTGEDYCVQFRAFGEDGVMRWFDSRGRVQRDAAGRPARVPGMVLDITARREGERTVAERARLSELRGDVGGRLAVGAATAETLQACCELIVKHLDAAFARIWTLERGETVLALKASAGIYTHLDGPHARVAVGAFKIGRIAQSRLPHLSNDVPHDPNISDPEWAAREGMVAFAGYPLLAEGEVVGVLAVFSRHVFTEAVLGDLAPLADSIAQSIERQQAERALRTAKDQAEAGSRAKDNFLAALSHELRTPLMPVLMTAAALRDDARLPADVREQLGMMERNIALEARLIDDLLDLTRITQGKLGLRLQPCDAHSLIGLAVEIVRDDAQAKGVAIEREFAATRSGLVADPARFQQVIWNLLRNAVKFTPAGGRIVVRTANGGSRTRASCLRIEVADSGIGIAPEAVDLIFQPFEQGGASKEHRFGGLGLGLAIARAIVDLHGGTIHAESAGTGRGATFIVELPEAITAPPGVTLSQAPSEVAGADEPRSLRLLLVEDHVATHEVLTRLLTRGRSSCLGRGDGRRRSRTGGSRKI